MPCSARVQSLAVLAGRPRGPERVAAHLRIGKRDGLVDAIEQIERASAWAATGQPLAA